MTSHPYRIFALDPSTRGFGYAVLDLPFELVEWGLARIRGEKLSGALLRFTRLLARFRPDVVVLEDSDAPGARRRPRVQALLKALREKAEEEGVAVATVSRLSVMRCFAPDGGTTKYSVAAKLAEQFPALARHLPPRRRIWQTEDERFAIFDAVALAVTRASA